MTTTPATDLRPVNLNLNRLETMAQSDYYNPYTTFDWPETIPEDMPWMSEDLLSLAGTEAWDALTREQQLAVAKHEAINFYSLNVHGIRDLISDVVLRMHTPIYSGVSEFLHHFVGEENEHMWFFSTFCLRYGKKIYPPRPWMGANTTEGIGDAAIELVVFSHILMFEELVDYFNAHMATDQALPEISREINRVHHQDESRHVAFGRQIFTQLLDQVKSDRPQDVPILAKHMEGYLQYTLGSLYNPSVYRDAGLPNPFELRRQLLAHPQRKLAHDRMLARTRRFLQKVGLGVQEAHA